MKKVSVQFGVMLPQTNKVSSPDAILQVAEAAEELGFDALCVHDHLVFNGFWIASGMPGASGPGDDRDLYEALETLTFAAARTSKVLLVASVIIIPIRHPVLLAKQIATLDALSGGRFVLGAGVGPPLRATESEVIKLGPHRGNAAKEYDAVDVSGNRGPRTDEYLEAMFEIWANEKATFHGKYVSFDEIEVFPKPVSTGRGRRSGSGVARNSHCGGLRNWLMVGIPVSPAPAQLAELLPEAQRLCIRRSRSQWAGHGGNQHSLSHRRHRRGCSRHCGAFAARKLFPSDEEYEQRTIVGSPDTFARRVGEFVDAGANYIELKPLYPDVDHLLGQMKALAKNVMPTFKVVATRQDNLANVLAAFHQLMRFGDVL